MSICVKTFHLCFWIYSYCGCMSLTGIHVGLMLTLNVEQYEDIEGYAKQSGILVWTALLLTEIAASACLTFPCRLLFCKIIRLTDFRNTVTEMWLFVDVATSAWWRCTDDGQRHCSSTWIAYTFWTTLFRGCIKNENFKVNLILIST